MGNSGSMRADDGEGLLAGYVTGPAAATEATAMAYHEPRGAVGLRAKAADQPKVNE